MKDSDNYYDDETVYHHKSKDTTEDNDIEPLDWDDI